MGKVTSSDLFQFSKNPIMKKKTILYEEKESCPYFILWEFLGVNYLLLWQIISQSTEIKSTAFL